MTTAAARKTALEKKYLRNCENKYLRDCHILFAFYNVGKVNYNWTGVRAVELDTEN